MGLLLRALFFWCLSASGQLNAVTAYVGSIASGQSPLNVISDWQLRTNMVRVAGLPTSSFASDSTVGSASGGTTFINGIGNAIVNNCIQDGYIKSVTCSLGQIGSGQQIKFKVFRYDSNSFVKISESETISVSGSTGTRSYSLSTPMLARPGDQLGFWVNGSDTSGDKCLLNTKSSTGAGNILYASGDVTDSNAFTSTVDNYVLCLNGSMNSPFIAITGDSISKGSLYNAFLEGTGPTWDTSNWARQVAYQLRTNFYPNTIRYQNLGKGGSTFTWAATQGVVYAVSALPRLLFIHSGINDIANGLNWFNIYNTEGVSNQLNSILWQCNASMTLMLDEIWPDGLATNLSLTIYDWNSRLSNWCYLNGASLLRSHDSMMNPANVMQLLPAYDLDGIHPNNLGVSNWCYVLEQSLNNGALNSHPTIPATACRPATNAFSINSYQVIGDIDNHFYWGQTNVIFPSSTNVCQVDFVILSHGSDPIATNTYTAHIYTMTGSALNIGTPVATSSSLSGDNSWTSDTIVSFHFDPPVTLSASTPYSFVLSQSPVSAAAYCWIATSTDKMSGSALYSANSSGAATGGSASSDVAIRIYAVQ